MNLLKNPRLYSLGMISAQAEQKYINRPSLTDVFIDEVKAEKKVRNKKIIEAIKDFEYSQNEIAKHMVCRTQLSADCSKINNA